MRKHVIVVGAGYAGVSAAMHCMARGHEVTLLEATDRIGGRASSFHDEGVDHFLDNGQHLFIGAYIATLELLHELGTEKLLTPQGSFGVTFIHAGGKRTMLRAAGSGSGAMSVLIGIMQSNHLSWLERIALVRGMRAMRGMNSVDHIGTTVTQLLSRLHQSSSLQAKFWTPFVLAVMNNRPEAATAALLVEVIQRVFFGTRNAARLMLPSVGLSALLNPMEQYANARGSRVLFGSSVNTLVLVEDRVTGVELVTGECVLADAVITAVPPHRLTKMLPRKLADLPNSRLLEAYEYSPIVTCYCMMDRAVMTESFLGSTTTGVQWIFNRSSIEGTGPGQLLALVISSTPELAELPEQTVRERCLRDLRLLLPEAVNAEPLWMKVIKEKRATFVCSPHMEPLRHGARTNIENLFYAGDWTKTHLPATIEGATVSGRIAANLTSEFLDQSL